MQILSSLGSPKPRPPPSSPQPRCSREAASNEPPAATTPPVRRCDGSCLTATFGLPWLHVDAGSDAGEGPHSSLAGWRLVEIGRSPHLCDLARVNVDVGQDLGVVADECVVEVRHADGEHEKSEHRPGNVEGPLVHAVDLRRCSQPVRLHLWTELGPEVRRASTILCWAAHPLTRMA